MTARRIEEAKAPIVSPDGKLVPRTRYRALRRRWGLTVPPVNGPCVLLVAVNPADCSVKTLLARTDGQLALLIERADTTTAEIFKQQAQA
jgi:hypothetical protein